MYEWDFVSFRRQRRGVTIAQLSANGLVALYKTLIKTHLPFPQPLNSVERYSILLLQNVKAPSAWRPVNNFHWRPPYN